MKFIKVIFGLVAIIAVGAIYMLFSSGEEHGVQQTVSESDPFFEETKSRQGDDPTYADEVEKLTILMRDNTLKQEQRERELESKLQMSQEKNRLEAVRYKEQVNSLNQKIKEITETTQEKTSSVEEELNAKLQAQLSTVTAAMENMQAKLDEMTVKNKEDAEALNNLLAEKQKNLEDEMSSFADSTKQSVDTSLATAKDRIAAAEAELANKLNSGQDEALSRLNSLIEGNKTKQVENVESTSAAPSTITRPYSTIQANTQNQSASERSMPNIKNQIDRITNSITGKGVELSPVSENGTKEYEVKEGGQVEKVTVTKEPEEPEINWPTVFPVYTLPPSTILTDSNLITPMIGRVPLKDNVADPFMFKVEVGSQNLAANGHQIPGIAKMILSGYATGIREQSCARGFIDMATFIFKDGTIVNHGGVSGAGSKGNQAIGYLADPWGKPCIRGQYINNAKQYLLSQVGATALESLAEAYAQNEVVTEQNDEGQWTTIINGNHYKYALGKTTSGGAKALADYVRARAANAFDVIYVAQNQPVQIVLNQQLEIDYDSNSRRVTYYPEFKEISYE